MRPGGQPSYQATVIGEASQQEAVPAPTPSPAPAGQQPSETPGKPEATAEPAETETPTATPTPDPLVEFYLIIESPESRETIVADQGLTVIGRTRIDAVVSVNDVFAEVDEDGRFWVPIVLEEGPNIIEVVVSVGTGEEQSEVLVVIYSP